MARFLFDKYGRFGTMVHSYIGWRRMPWLKLNGYKPECGWRSGC
jgi:hypothetical protein